MNGTENFFECADLEKILQNKAGVEMVDKFADQHGCEFMADFAQRFPVAIFLDLMGWPQDLAPMFRTWSHTLIHSASPEVRADCVRSITLYLRGMMADRRVLPQDDITSFVVHAKIDGTQLGDDEVLGMLTLLFLGGLDSVTAALGSHFRHLALHPELQERLREKPAEIPMAIEELLPALGIARCAGEGELPAGAVRPADGMDDDAVDGVAAGTRGGGPGRAQKSQRHGARHQDALHRLRTPVRHREIRGYLF
jgi:cytochrome P450